MRLKINLTMLNLRSIIVFLICVMLIGSSWEAVLGTTYLDDITLLFLIFLFPFTHKKMDGYIFVSLIFYSILCLLSSLFYGNWNLIDWFDAFKALAMFAVIYFLDITDKERDFLIFFFKTVNSISILIGILNYILFNIFHSNVILDTGTYKYINGIYVHRMSGFMLHSGFMAETCAALLIITLFKEEIKKFNYIEVSFYLFGVYCTRGRIPLAISCGAILFYILLKIRKHIREKWYIYLLIVGLAIGIMMSIPVYQYLRRVFSLDIEHQIRFIALRRIGEIFEGSSINIIKKIFLGCGVGYISTYYESHFAITFLNLGILGVLIWYFPFFYAELKMRFLDNKYKVASMTLLAYYLANTIVNKSYTLPFLEIVCIMLLRNNKSLYSKVVLSNMEA